MPNGVTWWSTHRTAVSTFEDISSQNLHTSVRFNEGGQRTGDGNDVVTPDSDSPLSHQSATASNAMARTGERPFGTRYRRHSKHDIDGVGDKYGPSRTI